MCFFHDHCQRFTKFLLRFASRIRQTKVNVLKNPILPRRSAHSELLVALYSRQTQQHNLSVTHSHW